MLCKSREELLISTICFGLLSLLAFHCLIVIIWNREWGRGNRERRPFMCSLNMPTLCFILLEFTLWQLEEHFPTQRKLFPLPRMSITAFPVYLEVRKQMLTPPPRLFTYLLLKCCTAKVCNKIKTRHKRWAPKRQLAAKNNISRIFLQFYFLFFVRACVCVCGAERALAQVK